ncbi:MAG TPA: purine-nucleoside phosphorylase, partial [Bacteroidetes bacterium]|nr:purine-nucleoside phosphorylase [Bacteroidota bacterium]
MKEYFSLQEIDEVADAVRKYTSYTPEIGIILGSGLGGLADEIEAPDLIYYKDLPYWPVSTVQGHVGRLVIGKLEEKIVLVMQG